MSPGRAAAFAILLSAALGASIAPAAEDKFSLGVPAIYKKAEAGDAQAQFMMGVAYDTGEGAPRNPERAEKWYRMAAEQGHANAQNSLGSLYQAQKKFSDARPWFEKAAAKGHPRATNNLGYLYDMGLGVPRDRRKALGIYEKASNLGSADAMWNIAHMHIAGQLDKPDLVTACVWAVRARRFAPQSETRLRGEISKGMTRLEQELSPAALARCDEDGVKWKPAGS